MRRIEVIPTIIEGKPYSFAYAAYQKLRIYVVEGCGYGF